MVVCSSVGVEAVAVGDEVEVLDPFARLGAVAFCSRVDWGILASAEGSRFQSRMS